MTQWIGTPNYTPGRGGQRVDHITLHIMAGYLTGTDATFQDTNRKTSATYGIGADGTVHQYVREQDTPWSDSDWLSNQTGISIEHEGGIPQATCTRACMDASARLCADIARRYGWTRLWHNGVVGNVYLHREIPGSTHTTCPDLAPNGLDVQYVINRANEILSGGSTMAVTPKDIWEYQYGPDKDKRNMYNRMVALLADTSASAKQTRNINKQVWEYHYPADKRNLNMYDKITRILDLLERIDKKLQ